MRCKAGTRAAGVEYTLNPGEGAFYGPKLEFVLKDAIGRDWQCGTWQVDLNLPERLGAHYVDEHSQKRTPVMLHRAIFGSLERFLGILLEHHAGQVADLARAGAGGRPEYHRKAGRIMRPRRPNS